MDVPTLLIIFTTLILTFIASYYVLAPMLFGAEEHTGTLRALRYEYLSKKESMLTAIEVLEYDMHSGKIEQDDYEEIKAQLESQLSKHLASQEQD